MSRIGGVRTAKRKILLRKYLTEQMCQPRCYQSPFVEDDEEDSKYPILNVTQPKKKYKELDIEEEEEEEENEDDDEILRKKINLDEADRFIASLKLPGPKRMKEMLKKNEPSCKAVLTAPDDIEKFKIGFQKLKKMQMAEICGEDEESDNDDSDRII